MLPTYIINDYEKVIKPILLAAGLKEKSTKYHNKIYDDHVKFYFLMLKEETKKSYRDIVEFIKGNSLHRNLCLKKTPHFTTLQKFLNRLGKTVFRGIIAKISEKFKEKGEIISVDSTGIEIFFTSHHYVKRINGIKKKYAKVSAVLDVSTQCIIDGYAEVSHKHDLKMLNYQFKNFSLDGYKFFVADKAYDSKDLFYFLKDNGVKMVVPLKKTKHTKKRIWKKHARKGSILNRLREKLFDEDIYHKRSMSETCFSSIKRRFGSSVNSVREENIVKEAYLKIILYNFSRLKKMSKSIFYILIRLLLRNSTEPFL